MQLAHGFSSFFLAERGLICSKYIKLKFLCKLRTRSKALRKYTKYYGNYDEVESAGNRNFSFFLSSSHQLFVSWMVLKLERDSNMIILKQVKFTRIIPICILRHWTLK